MSPRGLPGSPESKKGVWESSLKGHVALVTGASSRIGGKVVLSLARQGVHVAIGYRSNKVSAQRISKAAGAMGVEAVCYSADITQFQQVEALVNEILSRFNRLDIVVNSAGGGSLEACNFVWSRGMKSSDGVQFFKCVLCL